MIKVTIGQKTYEYEDGTTLYEIAREHQSEYKHQIILAKCNGTLSELFASGLEGYLHGRLRFPLRLALMAAGVVFVWPDTWADLTGFAILGAVTAHQYAIRKNNPDPVCLAQPQGE